MKTIYDKKGFFIKKYKKDIFSKFWWIAVIIISLGGLFYPLIGLLVPIFMLTLLILSYFKGRFWCGNLCPRGSFNDQIVKKYSMNKKIPDFIRSNLFRYGFLILFMLIFSYRVITVFSNFSGYTLLMKLGFIFATVCLITTILAMVLGAIFGSRTWCTFCPMGTLQKDIYNLRRKNG